MQITPIQQPQISFTADLKRLFDKGLLPEVKKGFYGTDLSIGTVSREHLLPKCKGGTRCEANIVLADRFLNNTRGSQPIWKVADPEQAVEYLEQFKGINVPSHEFSGNKYIVKVFHTLKRLGLDLTEQFKEHGLDTVVKKTKHIDFTV